MQTILGKPIRTHHVAALGIELEGAWSHDNVYVTNEEEPEYAEAYYLNGSRMQGTQIGTRRTGYRYVNMPSHAHYHGDCSVERLDGVPGEICHHEPTHRIDMLGNWIANLHPDSQNDSCGTHVHVSFNDTSDYDMVSTREFYFWFISQCVHFIESNNFDTTIKSEFYSRLRGDNRYCCPNWTPCHRHNAPSGYGRCTHTCDDYETGDCISCDHECDDETQVELLEGYLNGDYRYNQSCLRLSCGHDCDEDCVDSNDDCTHRHDTDCYTERGDCRHEHASECYACTHDCDSDGCLADYGDTSIYGCHIPSVQRKLTDKDCARYGHLNYCETLHGTIEVRLFPAMRTPQASALVVAFIRDAFEAYLSMDSAYTLPVPQAVPVVVSQSLYSDLNTTQSI